MMKVVRLYSNVESYFQSIDFNGGLNVVLAEIRLPENKTKSSHNLGKSTLARILDFCLLGKCDKNHFFKKRADLFDQFVFYLEVELLDGRFLTIRRAVEKPSRISFFHCNHRTGDLSSLPEEDWSHWNLPIEAAEELLDAYLNFSDISPWRYRSVLAYFLRTQSDYDDVFKLQRHLGADVYWKPILARILGLDAEMFRKRYELKTLIDQKQAEIAAFESQSGASIEQLENADGLIQLRESDAKRLQDELDEFDFGEIDAEQTKELVDRIDSRIALLNQLRYQLSYTIRQIRTSLDEGRVLFDPQKAKNLFEEAGVLFPDQIKADFDQLISFNKAITEERRQYLKAEEETSVRELAGVNAELDRLNIERKSALSFLRSEDVFEKYKSLSAELSRLRTDIEILVRQQDFLDNIQAKKEELRKLKSEYSEQQSIAEKHVRSVSQNPDSLLANTRSFFSAIIESVLGRKALLTVRVNDSGNLDFGADFVDANEMSTSEGDGTSYRKLMCVAFDLAVLRAHLKGNFPRFAFHDGIFEALDPRPKENLLGVLREYTAFGIQSVITLIDSDAPRVAIAGASVFDDEEVVVNLHDDGVQGRLFKFESW